MIRAVSMRWPLLAVAAFLFGFTEKSMRRLMREAAYRRKHPPGSAQCGINWYPAGSGWTHCHKCGQPLIYTTDRDAKPRECPGRRP